MFAFERVSLIICTDCFWLLVPFFLLPLLCQWYPVEDTLLYSSIDSDTQSDSWYYHIHLTLVFTRKKKNDIPDANMYINTSRSNPDHDTRLITAKLIKDTGDPQQSLAMHLFSLIITRRLHCSDPILRSGERSIQLLRSEMHGSHVLGSSGNRFLETLFLRGHVSSAFKLTGRIICVSARTSHCGRLRVGSSG